MKGYKMFNPDWTCREMQYGGPGTTARVEGPIKLCECGMHFCTNISDCFRYYRPAPWNHLCEVEAVGEIDGPADADSKYCTNELKIIRELPLAEMLRDRDFCMKIVSIDGWHLAYVENQTEDVCLAAVRQNGWALQYVKEQTPDICLAAVQRKGWALAYVKKQAPDICLAAVQRNGGALEYVKDQTPDICVAAVRKSEKSSAENAADIAPLSIEFSYIY